MHATRARGYIYTVFGECDGFVSLPRREVYKIYIYMGFLCH